LVEPKETSVDGTEPSAPRPGKVAFALLRPRLGQLPFDPRNELTQALRPGSKVERHTRVWRMSRVTFTGHRWVAGKIGFESPGGVVDIWNEDLLDFEEVALPQGRTSPFVVDLDALRVAFQVRTPQIKPRTFTGAFEALINSASSLYWRVDHEIQQISWEDWLGTVARVTAFRVTLERPNPGYEGREEVEGILEGTRSGIMNMILRADHENLDGLNVDNELLRQMIQHVQANHGSRAADGETMEGEQTFTSSWSSEYQGSPVQRTVNVDPTTLEASHATLQAALEELGISPDLRDVIPPVEDLPTARILTRYEELLEVEEELDEIERRRSGSDPT